MSREIRKLAALIKKRNAIEADIAAIINRPGEIGHVGEFIASRIFNINLEHSAVTAGWDGHFTESSPAGKTVKIKWYPKREGLLDLNIQFNLDYYLVLTGGQANAKPSRGKTRPWLISDLFETRWLFSELAGRKVKIGSATSVARKYWEQARVYPGKESLLLPLSEEKREMLALFG